MRFVAIRFVFRCHRKRRQAVETRRSVPDGEGSNSEQNEGKMVKYFG